MSERRPLGRPASRLAGYILRQPSALTAKSVNRLKLRQSSNPNSRINGFLDLGDDTASSTLATPGLGTGWFSDAESDSESVVASKRSSTLASDRLAGAATNLSTSSTSRTSHTSTSESSNTKPVGDGPRDGEASSVVGSTPCEEAIGGRPGTSASSRYSCNELAHLAGLSASPGLPGLGGLATSRLSCGSSSPSLRSTASSYSVASHLRPVSQAHTDARGSWPEARLEVEPEIEPGMLQQIRLEMLREIQQEPRPETRRLQLEALLVATSSVGNACLVTPRAGPFDGQLVALITSTQPTPNVTETSLLPESADAAVRRQITSLRATALEWASDGPRPDVWISLQSMATDADGRPDARRLQTWIQNLGDEPERRIMHMQLATNQRQEGLRRRQPLADLSSATPPTPTAICDEREILQRQDSGQDCGQGSGSAAGLDADAFFPLSVMQQLYFRTSMNRSVGAVSMAGPGFRFSQSLLLNVKVKTELATIEAALDALVSRHAMLRARFQLTEDGWAQIIQPPSGRSYRFGHQHAYGADDVQSVIEQSQSSLNILRGPVFAAEHIRCNDGRQLLYLVAHHLVVDLASWRTITHDLDELMRHGVLGSPASMTFSDWIDYQGYEANHRLVEPALPFDLAAVDLDYWGLADHSNCYGDTEQISFSLGEELASTIRTTCRDRLRTDSEDFFLAALLYSFSLAFTDRQPPTVWRQEQGRDSGSADFNIDQTVGWFTTLCPISVQLDTDTDLIHLIKVIKDTRKSIPRNGAPYFTSEFSGGTAPSLLPLEVMFNCINTLEEIEPKGGFLETIAAPGYDANSLISDVGQQVGRLALFEVSVIIDDSGASVDARYSRSSNHVSSIKDWMIKFEHLCLEGIGRMERMDSELTLTDAPLLKTSYDGVAKLTKEHLAEISLDSVARVDAIYPASPTQQEILVSRGQGSDGFHVSGTYELVTVDGGNVDLGRLCSAWESVVAAHPALRSVFINSVSDTALFDQVVLKTASPTMLFLDAGEASVAVESLASVPHLMSHPSQPHHRLSVCTSSTNTYIRLDASQALCDFGSLNSLVMQLSQAYSGSPPPVINPLDANPRDISHDTSYSLVVWKASIAGAESCIFPRLTLPSTGRLFKSRRFEVGTTREELIQFCRARDVDVSTVLQLAWALVVRAFVGSDLVCFGYEVSNRNDVLSTDVDAVGSFATVIPCFINFIEAKTIPSSLRALENLAFQTKKFPTPMLSEIEDSLGVGDRDLFNTCISFQDAKPMPTNSTSTSGSGDFTPSLISATPSSSCDLSLHTMFTGNNLSVDMSFRDLTPAQARSISGTFEKALKGILHNPSVEVSDVDLSPDRDIAQLLADDRNVGEVDACLHTEILRYSRSCPDEMAICSWDGMLTYREVRNYVSTLAAHLQNLGLTPGLTVPIVLERNMWTPVIMLAVLQAGGCFVTLDSHDTATAQATFYQINPRFAVATDSTWKFVSALVPTTVLVNSDMMNAIRPQIIIDSQFPVPGSAACAFITPGQAGRQPGKGIFYTHRSLCTAFQAQGPALKMDDQSRVMQLSSLNVDISLVEIMCSMFHGGCVCIPSEDESLRNIGASLARMKVNWTYMTSTVLRKISPSAVPRLKTLCFRTRALHKDMYEPWLQGRNILLSYGAPDICPLAISINDISQTGEPSLIAPPLLGAFYVVNPEDPRKLMPSGTVGELAIDCPALAPLKYAPGQTLEAARSSNAVSSKALMLTGHRVRNVEGGNFEYISSLRNEVIMNGCPVVMTDIERHIRQWLGPEVDIVVEPIETSDSVNVLAAFIELGSKHFDGPSELHALSLQTRERMFRAKERVQAGMANATHRGKRLPGFFIPSVFVPVRKFPLSTSLKVKKRKLLRMVEPYSYAQLVDIPSVPNRSLNDPQMNKPLPLTRTETSMRQIWARVLGKGEADIPTSSNFYAMGGSKFLATKLVLACRQNGWQVSLRSLLDGATLTEISRAVAAASSSLETPQKTCSAASRRLSRIETAGLNNRFIKKLVAPELGIDWHDVMDVTEATTHQIRCLETSMHTQVADIHCLVLTFKGPVRQQRLEDACKALVDTHPALRTAFAIHACRIYQAAIGSFSPEFERHLCPAWQLDKVADEVVQEEQLLPFDIKQPVTKFILLDGEHEARLVVRLSPSQITNPSVSLLVKDLTTLYEDADSSSLQRPTFFDYARVVQGQKHQEDVQFWKQKLKGASMTSVVPHNKPCPPESSVSTIGETIKMSPLSSFGFSFDTILRAAWAVVISTLSGSDDVLFGEYVDARHTKVDDTTDATSIAGPLTNTLPVRIQVPFASGLPRDFIQNVHDDHVASRAHEGIGTLELMKECTNWPYWTRFSTVVHHRSRSPGEDSATLNMSKTPFTYKLVEPKTKDLPDLLVSSSSSMGRTDDVDLTISCCPTRVPPSFAEEALTMLVKAIQMLTSFDSITKPSLQLASSSSIRSSLSLSLSLSLSSPTLPPTARIPLYKNDAESKRLQTVPSLPSDQRQAVQIFITSAWAEILNPIPSNVTEAQMHKARFYDLWGSLLPAQLFAEYFNQRLHTLNISTLYNVQISAGEIVNNPTMMAQYDLIVGKGTYTKRKTTLSLSPSWVPARSPSKLSPTSPSSASQRASTLRDAIRRTGSIFDLRRASMRELSVTREASSVQNPKIKSGSWLRNRISLQRIPSSLSVASIKGDFTSTPTVVATPEPTSPPPPPVLPPVEIGTSDVLWPLEEDANPDDVSSLSSTYLVTLSGEVTGAAN